MHLGLQMQEQHSSSTESTNLSLQEYNTMGKTNSQDQCASSDSVHDEGRHEQNANPALFLCNPELSMIASQTEIPQPMMQFPYAYPDPYLSGLYTAYGPHTMIQPPVMAAASGRIPLPADIPEDGPIYVNAKQYHGIIRRRQTRAKLEAQNKLVKNRRPYLHESRHQHALNRVRGTGGRFLSKNKSDSTNGSASSFPFNQQHGNNMSETNGTHRFEHDAPATTEGTSVSSTHGGFQQQQPDGRFPNMPPHMQGNGGFVYNGNRHYASIVR